METTFISIHDLSLDARLLYVSTSIEDILGYAPRDVIGKSCWEYFHPDEIPFAQSIHGRSIELDKAAVLNYCQIKNKEGRWVGCECVFTVVHDVLVASTSVYRRGPGSQRRAIEAPVIRHLFSSSPRDPRYHMLSYISHKFYQEIPTHINEPRAALFLNRFSRTLAIMYATNGLADLIGITADRLIGKSFYFCIQENCLREAVKCLESAKANDSIAYLRFWFRDPTQEIESDQDERMSDGHSSADDDDGGVHLSNLLNREGSEQAAATDSSSSLRSSAEPRSSHSNSMEPNSRSTSGNSTDLEGNGNDTLFDQPAGAQSTSSSISTPEESSTPSQRNGWPREFSQIELEAVVSCTSDGLVVVLRGARPFVPHVNEAVSESEKNPFVNGFFASPWAQDPILPDMQKRANPLPHPIRPSRFPIHPTAAQAQKAATTGPATEDFMNSIREVAVFAWSLTGINGSLVKYGRGTPIGESTPPGGLPVWDPNSNAGPENGSPTQRVPNGYSYSPVDGTPMYDQMQVDTEPLTNQVNGPAMGNQFDNCVPDSRYYQPTPNGNPNRVAQKSERGSRLKNLDSASESSGGSDAYQRSNALLPTQKQVSADQSIQNSNYNPFTQERHQSQGVSMLHSMDQANGHQNADHEMEYDPYGPENYHAANGTSTQSQHHPPMSLDAGWTNGSYTQRQPVNGHSGWS